jgi:hypothetical protein
MSAGESLRSKEPGTSPIHLSGQNHEDTHTTLIQLTRATGFRGRVPVAWYQPRDTEELFGE